MITAATRGWIVGNPVINIDEQFYLVVGERLLHGDLPYVDIWDRKPIGLFLIYAGAARLFANPVVGYQLLAALSVLLTSWLLYTMARRMTGFAAALGGAAAYPAWLTVFGGIGGQSPVFYNLPMAAAAALMLAAIGQSGARALTRNGGVIMLLAGVAIQIKYTAVFEGIYFGISLLWLGKIRGRSIARLGGDAVIWIACALAATLLACAAYYALGHYGAFAQANFLSVSGDTNDFLTGIARLAALCLGLLPFWLCIWLARHRWRVQPGQANRKARWILGWFGAGFAGFLLFGVFFDHYVLPLLLPLCLIAALAFESAARQRLAIVLVAGLGAVGGFARSYIDRQDNGNLREVSRLAAQVQPRLKGGCLYVNEELSVLYLLTKSCLPTRFVFPQHLALARYRQALGIDQLDELNRLFRRRPDVIVVSTLPDSDTRKESRLLLEQVLRRDYRPAGSEKVGETVYAIFARSTLPVPDID